MGNGLGGSRAARSWRAALPNVHPATKYSELRGKAGMQRTPHASGSWVTCQKGGWVPSWSPLISFCHEAFYSSGLSCLFSGTFQKPKSELMVRRPRGASRSRIVSCFDLFQI